MRRILLLAALAAADDHIHASHADIELARDFRVDKHHKIIVSNIGDEDLAFYYLGNEGNNGMEAEEHSLVKATLKALGSTWSHLRR